MELTAKELKSVGKFASAHLVEIGPIYYVYLHVYDEGQVSQSYYTELSEAEKEFEVLLDQVQY